MCLVAMYFFTIHDRKAAYQAAEETITAESTTAILETTEEPTGEESTAAETTTRVDKTKVSTTKKTLSRTEYAAEVIRLVNAERGKRGLSSLKNSSVAEQAASIRAKEISGKFSHTRPNGKKFHTVITDMGYRSKYRGENLARGQASPQQVVDDWMDSTGHRENILDADFTHIGVACYYIDDGSYYNYWVQIFTSGAFKN